MDGRAPPVPLHRPDSLCKLGTLLCSQGLTRASTFPPMSASVSPVPVVAALERRPLSSFCVFFFACIYPNPTHCVHVCLFKSVGLYTVKCCTYVNIEIEYENRTEHKRV